MLRDTSLPAALNLLPLDLGEYDESFSEVSLPIAIAALKELPNILFLIDDYRVWLFLESALSIFAWSFTSYLSMS